MKRGTSEEPFLDHKENTACSSDSEDNKLDDKDVVKAAAKAQEEQEAQEKARREAREQSRRHDPQSHLQGRRRSGEGCGDLRIDG